MFFKFVSVGIFALFFGAFFLEQTTFSAPLLSQKNTAVKSSSKMNKKPSAQAPQKPEKNDFWAFCEKVHSKLFKEDLDETTYPTDPFIKEIPSYHPKTVPCDFRPDAHSAGFLTKCKW